MYEMEGASPGSATSDRPVAWPLTTLRIHPPGPGTRSGYRFPGLPHVPRVAPGWCPFLAVNAFLPACASAAQELSLIIFWSFLNPHAIHRNPAVIRTWRRLSTGLLTTNPQVTGCNAQTTRIANFPPQSLFSWFTLLSRSPPGFLRGASFLRRS